MIEWNKVTWYSKLLWIFFGLLILPIWSFYLGTQYQKALEAVMFYENVQPSLESPTHQAQNNSEFGYQCEDGSEFTLQPSEDLKTIHIVPTTRVDTLPAIALTDSTTTSGALYKGQLNGKEISLTGKGETLSLSLASSSSIICHPIQKQDEAPLNFGD